MLILFGLGEGNSMMTFVVFRTISFIIKGYMIMNTIVLKFQ